MSQAVACLPHKNSPRREHGDLILAFCRAGIQVQDRIRPLQLVSMLCVVL